MPESFRLRKAALQGARLRPIDDLPLTALDSRLRSDFLYEPPAQETYLRHDVQGYGSALLSFSHNEIPAHPTYGSALGYMVVRSPAGFPSTNLDGVTVVRYNTVPAGQVLVRDERLLSGVWYYYGLFARYSYLGTTYWVRVSEAAVLIPINFGYGERLWQRIPEYYRRRDVETKGSYDKGVLRRFVETIGYEVDIQRTWAFTCGDVWDLQRLDSRLLSSLGELLGISAEDASGDKRFRKLLNNLLYLRKTKGTKDSIEGWVSSVTGYRSLAYVGKNLFLSNNDTEMLSTVGNWQSGTASTVVSRVVSTGGGGEPSSGTPYLQHINNSGGTATVITRYGDSVTVGASTPGSVTMADFVYAVRPTVSVNEIKTSSAPTGQLNHSAGVISAGGYLSHAAPAGLTAITDRYTIVVVLDPNQAEVGLRNLFSIPAYTTGHNTPWHVLALQAYYNSSALTHHQTIGNAEGAQHSPTGAIRTATDGRKLYAVRRNGTSVEFVVDGLPVGSASIGSGNIDWSPSGDPTIGGRSRTDPGDGCAGTYTFVGVANRPLTDAELSAIAADPLGFENYTTAPTTSGSAPVTNMVPVIGGRQYRLSAMCRRDTTGNVTPNFDWYTSTGALISTVTAAAVSVGTSFAQLNSAWVTAPVGAAFVVLRLSQSLVNAQTFRAYQFMLVDRAWRLTGIPAQQNVEPTTTYEKARAVHVNLYPQRVNYAINSDFTQNTVAGWSGSQPHTYALFPIAYATYLAVTDGVGFDEATYADLANGYNSLSTNTTVTIDTTNRWATINTSATASPWLTQTMSGGGSYVYFPVNSLNPYSVAMDIQSTSAAGSKALLKFVWFTDSTPSAEIGQASSQLFDIPVGSWSRIELNNVRPPANAAFGRVVLETSNLTVTHSERIRRVVIEDAPIAGPYFDGSFTDGAVGDYRFVGTSHQSFSVYHMNFNAMLNGVGGADRATTLLNSIVPPDRVVVPHTVLNGLL